MNEDDVRALLPPDHPDYRRPIPPPTELVSRDELAATALELARADAALAELLAQHAARLDDLEAHTLTVAVLELKPGSLIVVDLGTGADEHSVADATLAVDAALDAAGVDRDGIGVLFVSDGVELTVIEGEQ